MKESFIFIFWATTQIMSIAGTFFYIQGRARKASAEAAKLAAEAASIEGHTPATLFKMAGDGMQIVFQELRSEIKMMGQKLTNMEQENNDLRVQWEKDKQDCDTRIFDLNREILVMTGQLQKAGLR